MMPSLRRRPLYSACNEDSRSELRALEIGAADTVVAIAGGGGRALNLLASGAARLIALDYRVDQLYTLDLKCAAMDHLSYDDFAAFTGLRAGFERMDVYRVLRPALTASGRRYWDRRQQLIVEGVLYCGRLERTLSLYTRTLRRFGLFRFPEAYFSISDIEEQALLLERDRRRFERGVRFWNVFCNPLAVYLTMQDPGFLRSTEGNVGSYLWSRLASYGQRSLFRDSFLLHLIYNGRYPADGPLPAYLTRQGFELAKKHLGRLETRHDRLERVVERQPSGLRRKWSLSDVSCWLGRARFDLTVSTLVRNGRPGDRFCYRNFAAQRPMPVDVLPRIDRLDAMAL